MQNDTLDGVLRAIEKGTASMGSAPPRRSERKRLLLRLNDMIPSLCLGEVNATGNNVASRACGRAQEGIDELFKLAHGGNEFAAWLLAILVDDAALQVNLQKHRQLFRKVARRMPHWPVLASENAAFGHNAKEILRDLRVGANAPIFIDKYQKTAPDVFFKYAVQLKSKIAEKDKHATLLPPLGKDRFNEWWLLARKLFIEKFGRHTKNWPTDLLATIPPSRKSESQKREYVLTRLKQRMQGIARP